jgi:predicted dehydrogenase
LYQTFYFIPDMSTHKKIRVGLIGLNAPYSGVATGVNWAAEAHLPYLLASSKYELVALQNSSAERAALAIEAYGLDPEKVKAYGTPEGWKILTYSIHCNLKQEAEE